MFGMRADMACMHSALAHGDSWQSQKHSRVRRCATDLKAGGVHRSMSPHDQPWAVPVDAAAASERSAPGLISE